MKLIIAEKPELARDIAAAMMNHPHRNEQGYYEDNDYIIISSYGHLLELAEPEEYDEKYKDRNNLDILPICFKNWRKIPSSDEKYKSDRLKLIGSLIRDQRTSAIIHAGDPDDEGQNLIDEILDYFNYKGNVYRVLVNDSIPSHIQKEFEKLKSNESFRNMGNAAYARQMADKAFGINESRLVSTRLKRNLTVGRVQTPTLGLVVVRDENIENHIERKFFELTAEVDLSNFEYQYSKIPFKFKPKKELLEEDEKHIFDKNILEEISSKLMNFSCDCAFKEKDEFQYPPLPYNQTVLSAEMDEKYGYSLKQTLDITQALRDKYKIISYNRSDSQYLKEDHYKEADQVLECVFSNLGKDYPVDLTIHSKCFDDSKVTAHHGIIPVQQKVDIDKLTKEERNVYEAICNRYIMQFMRPIKKAVSSGKIEIDEGIFIYECRKVIEKGFSEFFGKNSDDEDNLFISSGDYEANMRSFHIEEKKTSPQKRYTQGTLVTDMCSISKYVKDPRIKQILKDKDEGKEGENGSIGTVATRAAIVENLIKRGYLEMKGKQIISTPLGRELYHLLPDEIKTPDITAEWWLIQEKIKNEGEDCNTLMNKVCEDFIKRKDIAYKNKKIEFTEKKERESLGRCPFCGHPVYESKLKNGSLFWFCSDYQNDCKFKLYENSKRFNDTIRLTHSKVKKLLEGKGIEAQLTGKNGKYRALLQLERNGSYINFSVEKYLKSK